MGDKQSFDQVIKAMIFFTETDPKYTSNFLDHITNRPKQDELAPIAIVCKISTKTI